MFSWRRSGRDVVWYAIAAMSLLLAGLVVWAKLDRPPPRVWVWSSPRPPRTEGVILLGGPPPDRPIGGSWQDR
jgi:hypothetical protein